MHWFIRLIKQIILSIRLRNLRLFLWCDIHPDAIVPSSTRFCHGGMGIIIGKNTILGDNVTIHPQVTIGARTPHNSCPVNNVRVGNDVIVYTGASIFGDICVGNYAIVSAHSLVLHDVPDYAIVCGVPAGIVRFRDISEIKEV